jgi:hypothetical protein
MTDTLAPKDKTIATVPANCTLTDAGGFLGRVRVVWEAFFLARIACC